MVSILTNSVTRDMQLEEAVLRLKLIGVDETVIENLKRGKIMYSERQSPIFCAALYEIGESSLKEQIAEIEKDLNGLVYHVQLTHTRDGDMYSFLYVSAHKVEWDYDRNDLMNQRAYAYVINGEFKEIGVIGIQTAMGGIVRTY